MQGLTIRTSCLTKWPFKVGYESQLPISSLKDQFLTRINNKNKTQHLLTKNISNLKPKKSFLKNYFDKNILYTNNRITSTKIERNRIDSVYLARQFIDTLTQDERKIIREQLELVEQQVETINQAQPAQSSITFRQLMLLSLKSGLPFIGFGFVDNFLMIVAGDMIETYIGFFLPISTMAAAGLGNAMSDVAGIGLAHHIEVFCSKFVSAPKLTAEDWNRPIVHWCHVLSKSICIFVGCLIGMAPLLFIKHEKKNSKDDKEDNKAKD